MRPRCWRRPREVRTALNGETLAGLVNNAGIAVAGPVLELAADEFRRQMEVNFIGPVIATQAFGPLLGSDPALKGPKGRIVMISSVAGKHGNPLTSAYAASKHAIEGLSESLRRELMLFGIDVIVVAPGAVKTPIWDKAEQVDISVYKNSPYFPALEKVRAFMLQLGSTGLPAETIAEKVFEALTLPNPKVRYTLAPDPMQQLMAAAAQAHLRPDHRQAPWPDAAGMILKARSHQRRLRSVCLAAGLELGGSWEVDVNQRNSSRFLYARTAVVPEVEHPDVGPDLRFLLLNQPYCNQRQGGVEAAPERRVSGVYD